MANVKIVQFFGLASADFATYVGSPRQMVINSDTCLAASIHDGATPGGHALLFAETNLAELSSPETARTNLGLGSSAVLPASAFFRVANNLSELTSPALARQHLGLGDSAIQNVGTFLQTANNLSDVASVATARTNLGLGNAAVLNTGTGLTVAGSTVSASYGAIAGTACEGNDARLSSPLQKASNLSDLPSAVTARANLGLTIGTNVQAYSPNLTLLSSNNGSALTNLNAAALVGPIPASGLPNPSSTALGGVHAFPAVSAKFLTSIGTDGNPTSDYPAFSLSGNTIKSGDVLASLANLVLTGISTAPTAAPGTNTGQIASCAFVQQALTSLNVYGYNIDSQAGYIELGSNAGYFQICMGHFTAAANGTTSVNFGRSFTTCMAVSVGGTVDDYYQSNNPEDLDNTRGANGFSVRNCLNVSVQCSYIAVGWGHA